MRSLTIACWLIGLIALLQLLQVNCFDFIRRRHNHNNINKRSLDNNPSEQNDTSFHTSFDWYSSTVKARDGSLQLAHPRNTTVRLGVGECTPDIPCTNGACCNGRNCGYGPDYCTPTSQGGSCLSNCDAKAECGQYATVAGQECPLNVCCSQYGFCGTTDEFCGAGCQSHCGYPTGRTCDAGASTSTQRRIGYYETWATSPSSRACKDFPPSEIPVEDLTHVNWAFALLDDSFNVVHDQQNELNFLEWNQGLRKRNPNAKFYLSIGGWSFNDPPTQHIFSNLAGSGEASIRTFASNLKDYLDRYEMDGADIDWEYPVAPERGGVPADLENFPTMMRIIKEVFAGEKGLTFTAPSSYWYLRHFDLPSLLQSADWVNVMTYDLHGVWDAKDPYISNVVLGHTNLTEIKDTLSLFDRVGIDRSQIVLGYGFYGRSFTLSDPSCSSPGCPFSGGADPGECSLNSGTLMFSEIEDILDSTGIEPIFDPVAAVNYLTWNGNQWVSYDSADTFSIKRDWANRNCLGGSMIWSVDQDDTEFTALTSLFTGSPPLSGLITGERNDWIFSTPGITGDTTEDVEQDEPVDGPSGGFTYDPEPSSVTVDGQGREAFGEVFISSPQASAVSNIDTVSDWVVTNCTRNSRKPQTVTAYCSKPSSDKSRGCDHVKTGKVENTIVRMPKGCGASPYARIVHMNTTTKHDLPISHHIRVPAQEPVYRIHYDYNFAAIPEDNGPVYMRADVANDGAYEADIVDEAPGSAVGSTGRRRRRAAVTAAAKSHARSNKHRRMARYGTFHHKRNFHNDPTHHMHKRWWGSFKDWLGRLNTVESEHKTSLQMLFREDITLYENSEACQIGNSQVQSQLKITASPTAQIDTTYGYYLQAQIVPPQVHETYVYFSAQPLFNFGLEVDASAGATFNSDRITLSHLGMPGMSYPGLIEVGPALQVDAYMTGSIEAQATLSATYQYNLPAAHFSIGRSSNNDASGTDSSSASGDLDGTTVGAVSEPGYKGANLVLQGDLSSSLAAHIVPSARMGISLLGGSLAQAEVYVEVDSSLGFNVQASAGTNLESNSVCLQTTWDVAASVGYVGNLLYQSTGGSTPLYSNNGVYQWPQSSANCMPFRSGPSKREYVELLSNDTSYSSLPPLPLSLPLQPSTPKSIAPDSSSIVKRLDGNYLPGSLFCPSNAQNADGGSCDGDLYDDDEYARRSLSEDEIDFDDFGFDNDTDTHWLFDRAASGQGDTRIKEMPYNNIDDPYWCDLRDPSGMNGLNGDIVCQAIPPLQLGANSRSASSCGRYHVYDLEHVLDKQLMNRFLYSLQSSFSSLSSASSAYISNANGDAKKGFQNWIQQSMGSGSDRRIWRQDDTLLVRLGKCSPWNGNSGGGRLMPHLTSSINMAKGKAFGGSRSINMRGKCASFLIGKIRSLIGMINYMNDFRVKREFQRTAGCMADELDYWLGLYKADIDENASINSAQLKGLLQSFLRDRLNDMNTYVSDNIQQLLATYNNVASKQATITYWPGWDSACPLNCRNNVQPKTTRQVPYSEVSSLARNPPALSWTVNL